MRRLESEKGFTLVEVLVALVVTSLILGVVMNASLQAKTRAVATIDKQAALMLAHSLVAGRSIAPFDPARRGGEAGRLSWSVSERTIATDPRALFLLSEIDVSVRNGKGVTLSALKARKIKPVPQT